MSATDHHEADALGLYLAGIKAGSMQQSPDRHTAESVLSLVRPYTLPHLNPMPLLVDAEAMRGIMEDVIARCAWKLHGVDCPAECKARPVCGREG